MPDDCDLAQERELAYREAALVWQRAATLLQRGPGRTVCGCECGCNDPIPEARQQAAPGCTRCIACQTQVDRTRVCAR